MRFPAALAMLTLAACSTLPSTSLQPTEVRRSVVTHPGRVLVAAEGSGRRMGLGRPLVAADELRHAVADTLARCGTFERTFEAPPVGWGTKGDYLLHVTVDALERDEPSLEMWATAALVWRLERADDGTLVDQRRVESKARATTKDSKEVEERGRVATELALQKNLQDGVAWLGDLRFTAEHP